MGLASRGCRCSSLGSPGEGRDQLGSTNGEGRDQPGNTAGKGRDLPGSTAGKCIDTCQEALLGRATTCEEALLGRSETCQLFSYSRERGLGRWSREGLAARGCPCPILGSPGEGRDLPGSTVHSSATSRSGS